MNQKTVSRLKKWLGIVAGIIAILGFLFEVLTGGTLFNLMNFSSHEIGNISIAQSFAVTSLKDNFGRNLESGDRFSYRFGIPLVAQGIITSELETSETVWIVLVDNYGKYFPQYPTLQIFNNNQWKATNIRPLQGITDILFIKVDQTGYDELKQSIDDNKFQVYNLPQSAEELGRIALR
jgi:hypothetical protein